MSSQAPRGRRSSAPPRRRGQTRRPGGGSRIPQSPPTARPHRWQPSREGRGCTPRQPPRCTRLPVRERWCPLTWFLRGGILAKLSTIQKMGGKILDKSEKPLRELDFPHPRIATHSSRKPEARMHTRFLALLTTLIVG